MNKLLFILLIIILLFSCSSISVIEKKDSQFKYDDSYLSEEFYLKGLEYKAANDDINSYHEFSKAYCLTGDTTVLQEVIDCQMKLGLYNSALNYIRLLLSQNDNNKKKLLEYQATIGIKERKFYLLLESVTNILNLDYNQPEYHFLKIRTLLSIFNEDTALNYYKEIMAYDKTNNTNISEIILDFATSVLKNTHQALIVKMHKMLYDSNKNYLWLQRYAWSVLFLGQKTDDLKTILNKEFVPYRSYTDSLGYSLYDVLLDINLKNKDYSRYLELAFAPYKSEATWLNFFRYAYALVLNKDFETLKKVVLDEKFERKKLLISIADLLTTNYYFKESLFYYEEAFKLISEKENGNKNIVLKNNYAYALSNVGIQLDLAEELSANTVREEPDNPSYVDTFAWICFRKGNLKEAASYLEKLILKLPSLQNISEYDEILYHLGVLDFFRGNIQKSLLYLYQVKSLKKADNFSIMAKTVMLLGIY